MGKIYKHQKFLRLFLSAIIAGFISTASAQLSGTYTIDSSTATGGTNFKSWTAFASAITANGVNGAVTVNVVTDVVETGQVVFPAIGGTSSTNKVTINGNNKVVQYSIGDAVILISGADWFTFDKLVVRNTTTSQYATGYRIYNNSDNNTIKNGVIEFSNMSTATTSGGAYISFSTSSTSPLSISGTNPASNTLIDNNLMRTTNSNSPGPAFGVTMTGNTSNYSSTAQNNTLSNNVIQNFCYMAVYMGYTNGNQVLKNDISRANASSYNCASSLYGIVSEYSYTANRSTKIDANTLHDWPYAGASTSSAPSTIYATSLYSNYGSSTYRFILSNNKITKMRSTSNIFLTYSNYSYYFDVTGNNSDDNDLPTNSGYFYGFYCNYTYYSYRFNSNTIKNCDGGYYWYGILNQYPTLANGVTEINDNVIQNNLNCYYAFYGIYSIYAQYSNSSYPTDIMRNTIKGNTGIYYYNRLLYCWYYGYYRIYDNDLEDNNANQYFYIMDCEYYIDVDIQRNKIMNNRSTNQVNYGLYVYYFYNMTLAHNLLVDNLGYYTTYVWYFYNPFSGNYKADFIQNTIRADGNKAGYYYEYLYLYGLTYYSNTARYIGNIFDFTDNYYVQGLFYNYNKLELTNNSYYSTSKGGENWATVSASASNATAWVNMAFSTPHVKNGEQYVAGGNNFAGNYASNRFVNQNNVDNTTPGAKDVYGVTRNPAKSDRGAVEGVLDLAQTANDFAPPSPVCAGYTVSPTITFKNNFAEAVTGFVVGMSDNGVLKATATMTNSIGVGSTNTVTFKPITFSQSGAHKVKFFLLNADDQPSNDSMTFTFNVLKSPGGTTLTQNTSQSSPAAMFVTTGKPDVTFPNEKLVYDMGSPATVGYTNADYGSKWVGTVSAKTVNGYPASSTVSTNNTTPFTVSLNAPKAWEDSTIEISIRIVDLVTSCDTIYKRKVLIAPKAVPDFKMPNPACEKADLFFETTSSVSSGSIDYEWDFGDGTPTTTEASPVHKFANYGTYTITLSTTTNPYGFTTKKVVTVNVTEVPNASIINTNACEGSAVRLKNGTVYGGSGVINYTWDYGDGSAVVNTTSNADKFKQYTNPGGYLVKLTATADGCANTTTKVVYQFSKPIANFSKVAGTCLNTEFKFANYSGIGLGQFGNLWDFDDAGNKATLKEPTYTFVTAGTKQVKLKVVSEFGCTDSIVVPVVVKQIPTTNFSYPFACSRTATPFTNLTNLNGETLQGYLWDYGDGFTSTATSPSKPWVSIGPRNVSLTTTLMNGCSTTETKNINVGVQPLVSFQVEDRCAGSEVPFTNKTTYSQGTIVYTWNFGDGNTSNVTAPVHTYGSSVSQTYTVQLKANIIGGCADSMSKTVTIQPLPTTCTFDVNGKLSAARTSPLQFVPTGGSLTNIKYTWLTGDGNQILSNGVGTQYQYAAPGKYCITMVASNDAQCQCTATKCITLTTDISTPEGMNNAVSIYPNPNSGIFNITLDATINTDMTVNVYNTLGELVKTVVVGGNTTTIDMSDFASGVYVVKVIAQEQVATKKITISR